MKRFFCLMLSFLFCFSLIPHSNASARKIPFSDDPKAIQVASNSVIMLSCYDKNGDLYSTGSAFAVFGEGVFVTNCHVIEKEVYTIKAQMETGLEFEISSVVAYNIDKDIAILRTEAKTGLEPLPIGKTEALERGEKVIAIGSPLSLINTLSVGLYSGTVEDKQVYLQFSAAISHGSSGGALFNDYGEVVGITTASFEEGQNLNLAIPIEEALNLWENRNDGKEELSIPEFYNEWEHIEFYSISYLLDHKADFKGQKIQTEGYVFKNPDNPNAFHLVSSQSDLNALQKKLDNVNNYSKGNDSLSSILSADARKEYSSFKVTIALVIYLDSSKVSYGDFIKIQGTASGQNIKNVTIIE